MFLFDVGVEIRAGQTTVKKFSLAIPFDTLPPRSLTEKVETPKTADLIFDSTTGRGLNGGIEVGDQPEVIPADVLIPEVTRDKNYSNKDFTLWNLQLAKPIEPGEAAYIRVRFPVLDTGKTWQWTKNGMRRSGAVLDFRISDIRSSSQIKGGKNLLARIMPIGSAAVFLMTPLWLHPRTVNPEPKYIRLLEGKVWADYLDRAPESSRRSRLVVRYWKPKVKEEVTVRHPPVCGFKKKHGSLRGRIGEARHSITQENPMRVFAEFKIDSKQPRFLQTFLGFGAVLVFALLFTNLQLEGAALSALESALSFAHRLLVFVRDEIVKIGLGAGALGVLSLLVTIFLSGNLRAAGRWMREKFLLFEEWFFYAMRNQGPR